MDTTMSFGPCLAPMLLIALLATLVMIRYQKNNVRKIHPAIYFTITILLLIVAWFIVFRLIGIPVENLTSR